MPSQVKPSTFSKKKKKYKIAPIPIPGRRSVEELLRRGIRPKILLSVSQVQCRKEDSLLACCRAAGWKIKLKDRSELDCAAEGLPHQGFVALIEEFPYLPLDNIIAAASQGHNPILIALDQIQDAGNLGAILRSAECAGAKGAIIPAHRSASINAAVIRRSAGAALHLPISRVANLSHSLDVLKEAGFHVFGADQEGSRSIYEMDFAGPIALVIGSESRGLRPGIKRRCDALMAIPLRGRIASLNASAAAAICLFEVLRQRICKRQPMT